VSVNQFMMAGPKDLTLEKISRSVEGVG